MPELDGRTQRGGAGAGGVSTAMSRLLWVAGGMASIVVASRLLSIARHGAPMWRTGDGAMMELYTIHALHGAQRLGAYSQFGWRHPGPLLFYLLAPAYALSGRSPFGLNVGALLINVASLALMTRVVLRRHAFPPSFALLFFGLIALYVARVPQLLVSEWNPHAPVLPLGALLVVSAEAMDGNVRLLPLVAFLASFVVQAHVGFAPVTAAITLMVVGAVISQALRFAERRHAIERWTFLALAVLTFAWLLPVAEELIDSPGNLTELWRYFASGRGGQPVLVAWRAWSGMLTGAFRPEFQLAVGGPFAGSSGAWPFVFATLSVAALVPCGVWAWRARHREYAALAALCCVSSAAGFLSVLRINVPIGDYQIFWLSLVGVMNVALVAAAVVSAGGRLGDRSSRMLRLSRMAAVLFIVTMTAIGYVRIADGAARSAPATEDIAVADLMDQIQLHMPAMGGHRVLLHLGAGTWPLSPGLILRMIKTSTPFALDAAEAQLFGLSLITNGQEDVLLTLCGPQEHAELVRRPHDVILAEHDPDGQFFVDGIESGR